MGSSEVLPGQVHDGRDGVVESGGDDRLSRRPEACGHGLFPAGGHLDEVTQASQHAGPFQQVGGAVALLGGQPQRLHSRGEGGFLPCEAGLLRHDPRHLGLVLRHGAVRGLPRGVQA